MKNAPTYLIESVDNALRLLLILHRDGSVRVSTAAEELQVARSTAHRLLAMLAYRGFVVQDADRSYLPGAQLSLLASGATGVALPAVARPHLQALSKLVGETVNLMTLTGASVRFLESAEGTEVLRVGSRQGVSLPARLTSGGKVLLADLSEAELLRRHPELAADGPELAKLLKQLKLTRRRGYGFNGGETEPGVVAIAVGIRDGQANLIGALSIASPTVRYRGAQISTLLPPLRAAAEHIRRDLISG